MSKVAVEVSQGIATITFNAPKSFNAITHEDYDAFAQALRDIDKRDDVVVTVWQATGKWFCSGTSVTRTTTATSSSGPGTRRNIFLDKVAKANTDTAQALYSHSKILVAALNGPVMAFLGHFDFIYCMPEAWLSVPFTFIGIITEGGSSTTFAKRMGVAKANEVLIFGKKQTAQELLDCGFVNKIFPSQSVSSFHAAVRSHLASELAGLDPTAVLQVKKLLKVAANEQNDFDAVNLRESYAQAERFESGVPGERFAKLARKELRHKL
ncbi:ClpP/crotonase [Obba rivulosa]|uniref:ClpP/crotonase n=1 Tax=Obba rivulosa TaxID=1052685 RepID=A0A8E2DT84_9APHY|nr:ClpP/crotonase [Obba rivulosa]